MRWRQIDRNFSLAPSFAQGKDLIMSQKIIYDFLSHVYLDFQFFQLPLHSVFSRASTTCILSASLRHGFALMYKFLNNAVGYTRGDIFRFLEDSLQPVSFLQQPVCVQLREQVYRKNISNICICLPVYKAIFIFIILYETDILFNPLILLTLVFLFFYAICTISHLSRISMFSHPFEIFMLYIILRFTLFSYFT